MNEIELAAFVDRAEHFARCRHHCMFGACGDPLPPLPPNGIRLSYGPFPPDHLTGQERALAEVELTRRLGAPALIWTGHIESHPVPIHPGWEAPAVADYGDGMELILTRKEPE